MFAQGNDLVTKEHLDIVEEVMRIYKARCGSDGAHAIADLICDLGHYAEDRGIDFVKQVNNGLAHWRTEKAGEVGLSQFMKSDFENGGVGNNPEDM